MEAELLNDQFQSVSSRNTPLMLKHLCQQATTLLPARVTSEVRRHPIMPDFHISSNGISKLLKNLKPNKAVGPNKIHPLVLRELREAIASILEAIFTKSLDTGKLPDAWKSEVCQSGPHIQKRIETSTSQLPASLPDLHMLQTSGTHRGQPDR